MPDRPGPAFGLRSVMVAIILIGLAVAVVVQGRMLSDQGRRITELEAITGRLQKQNLQLANGMMGWQQSANRRLQSLGQDVRSLTKGRDDRGESGEEAGPEGP